MIGVSILGSTGSIGRSTIDVMSRHPSRFRAVALSANTDVEGMLAQVEALGPELVAMRDGSCARELAGRVKRAGLRTEVLAGEEGLIACATHPGVSSVVAAIVGSAGLAPTLGAVDAGTRIVLANKEALVTAGPIFMDRARASGCEIIPVDSEHNAIFQCLPDGAIVEESSRSPEDRGISRILLTGSGGPFLDTPMEALERVTPDEACAHPKWTMGRKISVDSATMMNKGLEVIEAHLLFGMPLDRIQVVVHPQSVIHSMVQFADGSTLAQLGNPDMRTPIANALAHPERIESGVADLDIFGCGGGGGCGRFDFREPDFDRFPCMRYAYESAEAGGTAPAVLNAANEVAVGAFLEEKIRFTEIPRVIESCLGSIGARPADTLDDVLDADRIAREEASRRVEMAHT